MKSNKVLLGLFAGLLALTGGVARAQVDTNFHEIGPANIGGHVSSLVVDNQDSSRSTIYAGAISGGLYVRSENPDVLGKLYANVSDETRKAELVANTESWHLVRYIDEFGHEQTLPISALAQGPDGTLFIGTGDNTYALGSTYNKMSQKGRGVFRYNPNDGSFKLIDYTNPAYNELFSAVRAIDYIYRDGILYLFVATNTGLYRWRIDSANGESDWGNSAHCVMTGDIDQLLVIRSLNMAYFTIGNQLYRLGDLTVSNANLTPLNISSSNSAFGGTNVAIKLAVAPSDPSHLYAMVINAAQRMENVYLSTNSQTWTPIATSSVQPLTSNSGLNCGAIAVDPANPKHIAIAGSNIWIGQGFPGITNFQWTRSSYSEYELNGGDYMSSVFNTNIFVHSGIHKMTYTYNNETGITTFYIATDGGVFSTTNMFGTYSNINRGMNNVQVNGIAVSPDGSVISGANSNACPFIESRMAHNEGTPITAWYDNGTMGNMNHDANVLWSGDGGKVAASAFQQINTQAHRNIFVSSSNGNYGRSYADYLNFTNTQTWTIGNPFLTGTVIGGPTVGSLSLWETSDNTVIKDSVKVGIDLKGFYIASNGDTVQITGASQVIPANAKVTFLSKANSEYPFEHTFTTAHRAGDSLMVQSPVLSRLLIVAQTGPAQTSVLYSWTANDFSKIYDSIIDYDNNLDGDVKSALREKFMWWAPILDIKRNAAAGTENLLPRDAVMNTDGTCAYVSTYDLATHQSQLYRVSGFENLNFNLYPADISRDINSSTDSSIRVLRNTVLKRGGTNEWFNRPISSIAVDPRPGMDRIVLTFEDYSSSYANVIIIDNASSDSWGSNVTAIPITNHGSTPAYSAIIEKTTGDIYVGTAEGVFIYKNGTWSQYEQLRGVPVTSIVQQIHNLPVRRVTTHTGIYENKYLFAKTKWPNAIYFGTYGRGIFMDMTYVTDRTNEICDPEDYAPVSIPVVNTVGQNSVSVYPNPVMGEANLAITAAEAGNAILRIYDLNGRLVSERALGYANEGEQVYTIGTEGMAKGMYLVNVIIGGHTAATKMMVR